MSKLKTLTFYIYLMIANTATIQAQNQHKTTELLQSNEFNATTTNSSKSKTETEIESVKLTTTPVNEFLLQIFIQSLTAIKTPKCYSDLNHTINGIQNANPWAIAMYDASVKLPTGIQYGNKWQLGNFDECIAIGTGIYMNEHNVKGKYCITDIQVDGYHTLESSRTSKYTNSTTIHFAVCMPASCSSNDIVLFLSHASGYNQIQITSNKCHVNEENKFTIADILYGCVIMFFVLMTTFSTLYHCCMIYNRRNGNVLKEPRKSFHLVIKSFSILENLKKLVKGSSDQNGLSFINGIKATAMLFILGGHALVHMLGGPVQNTPFYNNISQLLHNAFLMNSPLLVDTFLLLGGFLFARLLFLEMDKRNGSVNFFTLYLFRYIRLTPAYLAMIGLYATWLPKLGDGPLWDSRMQLEQERCQNSWWKNILYINNYIGTDSLCMFQSWYLATDTQLFVIAPLILYPLWKWKRPGEILLVSLTVLSAVVAFVCTYVYKMDPTLLIYMEEVYDLSANYYFIAGYGKTHMRATAYLFGLLAGYMVHRMQIQNISVPRKLQYILWATSTVAGTVSMFYVNVYYLEGHENSVLENAVYAGLHRFGWSFSNAWLVFACAMGCGGPVKKFLAAKVLTLFSRLTYCAYLTNGLVELYLFSTIRSGKYLSIATLTSDSLAHIALTFLTSLVLCLMFESPVHGLEKIFIRRQSPQKRQKIPSKIIVINNNNNNSRSTSSESVETA